MHSLGAMVQPDWAPLTGFRVAVTSARRAEELSALLCRRGASVTSAAAITMVPLPDDVPAGLFPAFLSSGYHVRVDIPGHVAASGHRNAVVTTAMGPAQNTVRVVVERLLESGWRPSDSVVLAAAGTSDPNAQRDLRVTATLLSAALGQRVELAYAATGEPSVGSAVAGLRDRGARRVVVASYLLADGLFQDRLRASGADVVAEPLGTHPGVVRLIASRFRRAVLPVAA